MCNLSERGRSRALRLLVQWKPSPFTQPWAFQLTFHYFESEGMFLFFSFPQKKFKQWPNESEWSLFQIMTLQRPDWAVAHQTSMCQPRLVTVTPSSFMPCSLTPLGLWDGPFLEFQHDISKHVYLSASRRVFILSKWNRITSCICIWPNSQTWTPSVITSLKLIRVITDRGRGIGMPEDRPSYRRLAGTPCLEQTLLLQGCLALFHF